MRSLSSVGMNANRPSCEISRFPRQGASAHARFFDHAGSFGPCDGASETAGAGNSVRGVIGVAAPGVGRWFGVLPAQRTLHRSDAAPYPRRPAVTYGRGASEG